MMANVETMATRLFDLECEETVDDEDDSLDESQSGLGETEVGVAGIELPVGEMVVGEPGGEDVEDGSGHAEEQVHRLVDGVAGHEAQERSNDDDGKTGVGSGGDEGVEWNRLFDGLVVDDQDGDSERQLCDLDNG